MAQLRQDYQQFVQRDTEIVVVGPEDSKAFANYWTKEGLPFVGLPDPEHIVADRYGQEVKLLKFGRMPAIITIDKQGQVLETHYADNMRDYPSNSALLALLDESNAANHDWTALSNIPEATTQDRVAN
jgi:peroxiredoxin